MDNDRFYIYLMVVLCLMVWVLISILNALENMRFTIDVVRHDDNNRSTN